MNSYEIPKELIAQYLGQYIDDIFENEEMDMRDPTLTEECFKGLRTKLEKFGEQEFLAAGLKKLINEIQPKEYMNYSNQEASLLDEDMEYLVKTLYQKTKPTNFNENAEVSITGEKIKDWRIENGFYHKTETGDTLSSIAQKKGLSEKAIVQLNKPDFEECGLYSPLKSEFVIVRDKATWL